MAPTTAEVKGPHEDFDLKKSISWCLNEDIVITGVSGRFPEADTVEEFKQKLYDGVDMVTEDDRRYPAGVFGMPKRMGKIKDISRFDAQNFGINAKMAHEMDPQMRILVETTQEAILDAGINPTTLRGSRTGVFLACSGSDAYTYWSRYEDRVHGYGMLGGSQAMIANRISFTFDFKGPSYAMDASCSSSLFALNQAVQAIRTGTIDNAVVCGVNLILQPTRSMLFKEANLYPSDGVAKPLDDNSDGFEKSEAVVVCFLQKRNQAKRVYANILASVVANDGKKEEDFFNVAYKAQVEILKEALKEGDLKASDIEYVETHTMGTKLGDSTEVNAISEVLLENRKEPLLVGSVKSNMGHAECSAGLCGIVKALLTFETGVIPANLRFQNPNKYIPALLNSQIKVVDKPTPYKGGVIAVNSIGLSGTDSIVLLRPHEVSKTVPEENKKKFRLICAAGRNTETVNETLDKIVAHREDEEFLSLVNDVYSKNITGYDYKGYAVITDDVVKEVQQSGESNRPVWYVFAGMGSQWAGMARDLIKIPVCEKAIRKIHEVLLGTENYNLLSILLSEDELTFDNILNSLTCIAVVQVALVDLLTSLGITPDGMIGHSAGEVGCAYADGTLTAEETVFTAYYRGRSILEANLDPGAMAAIGLTWEETKKRIPESIVAACHNSADSVTISGPPADIKAFVEELKSENVFAREVKSSGCAFHSKYVAKSGPIYKKYLEKVIKNPKLRTSRWITSSHAESKWNTPEALYSGPDYHVNNLLSPVLFREAMQFIPANAIAIEIAPHHLMQAIVKRALGPKATVLGLLKRQHKNNLEFILSNIGKFYIAGGSPNLNGLLSTVQYPVARNTPMVQSIIGWDHSDEWTVPDFMETVLKRTGCCDLLVDLTSEEYSYVNGHIVDGRIVFPGVGYMEVVWKVFAKLNGSHYKKFPVVLENVNFYRATILPENGSVVFTVSYLPGSNLIELSEGSTTIMKANIRPAKSFSEERFQSLPVLLTPKSESIILTKKSEIYKFFVLLGFTYYGNFLGIRSLDPAGVHTELEFSDEYGPFMDTILQAAVFSLGAKSLHLPVSLNRVLIDPITHQETIDSAPRNENGVPYIPMCYYEDFDLLTSGGIEFRGLTFNATVAKTFTQQPLLEKYVFVPFKPDQESFKNVTTIEAVKLLTDLVIENSPGALELKVMEYTNGPDLSNLQAQYIAKAIESVPLNKIEAITSVITDNPQDVNPALVQSGIKVFKVDSSVPFESNHNYIVTERVASDLTLLTSFLEALVPGGFLLTGEQSENSEFEDNFEKVGFQLISTIVNSDFVLYFLKKPSASTVSKYIYIDETYKWVDDLKSAIKESQENGQKILLIGQQLPTLGILGLFNCLKIEPGKNNVRCLFLQDPNSPTFSENDPFFQNQLKKDLTVNVFKDNQWGSYRHVVIPSAKENKIETSYAYVDCLNKGDINSIEWIQDALPAYRAVESPGKKLCYVYYSSLSENEVLMANIKGCKYPTLRGLSIVAEYIGMEFSGKDEQGKRVMGLVGDKALATTVFADDQLLWEVPEDWSLEQATTIPLSYSVAYYALYICGHIKPTSTVLIYEGSTALAQAALSICLNLGCQVFVTGSEPILLYLKSVYPQLPEESLIKLDNTILEYVILRRTKGKGVDLILNSSGDQFIRQYFSLLKRNGKFLDTRKVEGRNLNYEADFIKRGVAYHSIYPESFFKPDASVELKAQVANLVKEGIANGVVIPSLSTPFIEVDKAITFINEGNYIGKVVIEVKEEFDDSEETLCPATVSAIRKVYFNPKKTYILLGGLGGFGLELVTHMTSKYAKNIILVSRSGVKTGNQKLTLKLLKDQGTNVIVSKADCSDYDQAEKLINEANKIGPVGGIFNLAAILKDAIFENLSPADFEDVAKPKVKTTKILDELSRKLCPELDYFVTFSSVSCGRGNAGQTNYGMANSAMDRICEQRVADGYPAVSIQWGAIGDVGMVLEKLLVSNNQEVGGIIPQRISACLSTLEYFIQLPHPVVSTVIIAEKSAEVSAGTQLQPVDVVANILGIKDASSVNKNATLVELGTDSLTNVEIKQTLERKFGILLSAQEVLQLTFEKINELQSSQ